LGATRTVSPADSVAPLNGYLIFTSSSQPPDLIGGKYHINIYAPVKGLVIGDASRVEQHDVEPARTIQGDWETLIAQLNARLDALSAQLDRGVDDLKRGQTALYRHVDQAYRDDLARVLVAVQQGRLEQGEMQRALDALRRATRGVLAQGLPMHAELRDAMSDLTQALEHHLSLERKLELSLPLIPLLLDYKVELAAGSAVDVRAVWDKLCRRARDLGRSELGEN